MSPDQEHGTSQDPVPPKEPFAYMSGGQSPIPKIRTPVLELLLGMAIVIFGIYFPVDALVQHSGLGAGFFLFVMFAAVGGLGAHVGWRRLLWKREYTRMMGRTPW